MSSSVVNSNVEIAKALGLDTENLASATLNLQAGMLPMVSASYILTAAPGQLHELAERRIFVLVPSDAYRIKEHALAMAEAFVSGFEGDEAQEGIDELLATIRAAMEA